MKYSYSSIQKSFHSQEPWINVFILKHITLPLVYVMINYTKITPNIISILSITFGVFSAYNYMVGNVFLGGLMYFISYIFDATDGKVARITKTGKPYGAWLDICIDRVNLVIITTAIAYNYFNNSNDANILILNCLFLGLAFIGWESRYNIDYYTLKNKLNVKIKTEKKSKYSIWCIKQGVIKMPISLPELFLFYLIIAPNLKLELYSLILVIFFLALRIVFQQKFWTSVLKDK